MAQCERKKTTTVVKWNCSQFSRGSASNYAKELHGLGYVNGFCLGFGYGFGYSSKDITAAVVPGIQLKTNFVYVKYINYIFKWELWFCFVFFYLSSLVKAKCRQHSTAISHYGVYEAMEEGTERPEGAWQQSKGKGKHSIIECNLIVHIRIWFSV